MGDDCLPLLLRLLPGITPESDWRFVEAAHQEFFQFVKLAVGEGIHGIDDNGLNPPAAASLEHVIYNGDDVGQTFPRTRAGGQHIIVARLGGRNRIGLMLVQPEGIAFAAGRFQPEDVTTKRV